MKSASLPPALVRSSLLFAALAGGWGVVASLQAKPSKAEVRELKRDGAFDLALAKPSRRDDKADTAGGRADPGDAQSRIMAKLREQFEVTDDAEWEVIAARIEKVNEYRRVLAGSVGGRGAPALSDKGKKSSRDGTGRPEQDALRAALRDKMPDAEIKVRLSRVHEVHQLNEFRLNKAQADLRAVLTVRQEAVAVMAGLLSP